MKKKTNAKNRVIDDLTATMANAVNNMAKAKDPNVVSQEASVVIEAGKAINSIRPGATKKRG